jgi:hypothetical protein
MVAVEGNADCGEEKMTNKNESRLAAWALSLVLGAWGGLFLLCFIAPRILMHWVDRDGALWPSEQLLAFMIRFAQHYFFFITPVLMAATFMAGWWYFACRGRRAVG